MRPSHLELVLWLVLLLVLWLVLWMQQKLFWRIDFLSPCSRVGHVAEFQLRTQFLAPHVFSNQRPGSDKTVPEFFGILNCWFACARSGSAFTPCAFHFHFLTSRTLCVCLCLYAFLLFLGLSQNQCTKKFFGALFSFTSRTLCVCLCLYSLFFSRLKTKSMHQKAVLVH